MAQDSRTPSHISKQSTSLLHNKPHLVSYQSINKLSGPLTMLPYYSESVAPYTDMKDDVLPNGSSSLINVLGNMLNALIGSGVLGIPYVLSISGIFGGISLMIIFAIVSSYTLNILVISAQKIKVYHYEKLCYHCFGDIGYIFVSMCLFVMDYGSMLAYLIILGDASFEILKIWEFNTFFDRQMVTLIISMIIIFPACLFRDIKYLEKLSIFKAILMSFVLFVVIFKFIQYYNINKNINNNNQFFNFDGMSQGFGIIAYTFIAQDSCFLLYNSLSNPTQQRWRILSISGILSAMTVSLSIGIPAVLTFGEHTYSNILNNYNINEPMIIIARILYIIGMALTYPTGFFVARHAFVQLSYKYIISKFKKHKIQSSKYMLPKRIMQQQGSYSWSEWSLMDDYLENDAKLIQEQPLILHLFFSLILFSSNLALGLLINDLGIAMEIVGCISCVNLGFVLPGLCYLKICVDWNAFNDDFVSLLDKIWIIIRKIIPSIIVVSFGTFVVIYGSYKAIKNVILLH